MTTPQRPLFTRVMRRFLDPTKRIDYLIATLLAAWPAVFAFLIGVHATTDDYIGYWYSPQWMVFIPALPFTLFIVRWAITKILPDADDQPPSKVAGLVQLAASDEGRKATAESLRSALLSPRNILAWLSKKN